MPILPNVSAAEVPDVPIGIIAGDELGLIKVVVTRSDGSSPRQTAKWGEPERRHGIRSLTLSDGTNSVLAAARGEGIVELLNPITGATLLRFNGHEGTSAANGSSTPVVSRQEGSSFCGIQLFETPASQSSSLLTCTEEGSICVRRVEGNATQLASEVTESVVGNSPPIVAEWGALKSENSTVTCLQVDGLRKVLAVGGKGLELGTWDLETKTKTWAAKSPKPDNFGILPPPWVTSVTYMRGEDSRKVAIGTGLHSIRLYDVAAQRRPVMIVNFGDSPIKALTSGGNENCVFAGNGKGELAEFDLRTGKMVGVFKGAQTGSIRSLAKHPSEPLLVSCGLDRFLRIHNTNTRALVGKVFLKQPLICVLFDQQRNIPTDNLDVPMTDGEGNVTEEALKGGGEGEGEGEGEEKEKAVEIKKVGKKRRKKQKKSGAKEDQNGKIEHFSPVEKSNGGVGVEEHNMKVDKKTEKKPSSKRKKPHLNGV